VGGNEKIAFHCLTCGLCHFLIKILCKSLGCSLQRGIDFLVFFLFRLLCVYQGKHLSQDSSSSVMKKQTMLVMKVMEKVMKLMTMVITLWMIVVLWPQLIKWDLQWITLSVSMGDILMLWVSV